MLDVNKTLCLVRHAKSDYPPGVADFYRPLAKRGLKEAPAIGRWLANNFSQAGKALVSAATRTQQTWQVLNQNFDHIGPMQLGPAIYEASVDRLMHIISAEDDSVSDLLLVGHSPGLENLALLLSQGRPDEALRAKVATKFPTSSILLLRSVSRWAEIGAGSFDLSDFHIAH